MIGSDLETYFIENWSRVRSRLRAEVGEAAYRSWLKPLTLAGSREGSVRLAVPSRFMRDWVASNYRERILALWRDEDETIGSVEIVVQPPSRPDVKPAIHDAPAEPSGPVTQSKSAFAVKSPRPAVARRGVLPGIGAKGAGAPDHELHQQLARCSGQWRKGAGVADLQLVRQGLRGKTFPPYRKRK